MTSRAKRPAGDRSESGGTCRPYSEFAAIYDAVMKDVPYEMWADYVEELCRRQGNDPVNILDIACGTGNSTLPFAARGYRVTGVDSSQAMLAIARTKARARNLKVEFATQDMKHLAASQIPGGPEFDLVICLYDSINYLTDPAELGEALAGFLRVVCPGGLLILDVNAARNLHQMTDTSIFLEGPGWTFIEQNAFDPATSIWEITVTGFLRHRGELYRRFREVHRERAYSEAEMRLALSAAGFEVRAAYSAFGLEPAGDDTARIYLVARRPFLDPR